MSEPKDKSKPASEKGTAPLSGQVHKHTNVGLEQYDIGNRSFVVNNTIRNTHPAPRNPERNSGGNDQDKK